MRTEKPKPCMCSEMYTALQVAYREMERRGEEGRREKLSWCDVTQNDTKETRLQSEEARYWIS